MKLSKAKFDNYIQFVYNNFGWNMIKILIRLRGSHMSRVSLVSNQEKDLHQDPMNSEIKIQLEKRLSVAKNEFDFLKLISDINGILKDRNLNQKNKIDLRNFRQKVYDRKKKCQEEEKIEPLHKDNLKNDFNLESRIDQEPSRSSSLGKNLPNSSKSFKNLDPYFIFQKLPPLFVFLICACVTTWFVWKQSVPLYKAVGFSDPKFCALGAIMMIVGFASIYTMTKSKFVLLLCLYASTYEVVLIVNGTIKHDAMQIQNNSENNSQLLWLQEQVTHSEQVYQTAKSQFEDPNSKAFQSTWYKEKYVNPAWEKYSADQNKLFQKHEELNSESKNVRSDSMLKILFRLGLVFLCMVSIHNLLKLFNSHRTQHDKNHFGLSMKQI